MRTGVSCIVGVWMRICGTSRFWLCEYSRWPESSRAPQRAFYLWPCVAPSEGWPWIWRASAMLPQSR